MLKRHPSGPFRRCFFFLHMDGRWMELFVHAQAFCNYASNPGCGGSAGNGVVTFRNIRHAYGALVIKLSKHCVVEPALPQVFETTLPLTGCRVKPVLSIPRSYIRDLEPCLFKSNTGYL